MNIRSKAAGRRTNIWLSALVAISGCLVCIAASMVVIFLNDGGQTTATEMIKTATAMIASPPTYTPIPKTVTHTPVDTPTPIENPSPTSGFTAAPSFTSWPTRTLSDSGGGIGNGACSCDGNTYNCSDFSSQRSAQACYDYCKFLGYGDVHRLDADKDGLACEGR